MSTPHYINGRWVSGNSINHITAYDPSLGQPFDELIAADAEQVNEAVVAARRALPGWSKVSAVARADYLQGFADRIEERRESLISLLMQNNGKPRHEANVDIDDAAGTFRYYANIIRPLDGLQNNAVALSVENFSSSVRAEPIGVVGLIVPWNFPLVTSAWKLAPALAAGCTVVLKPSEVTPLIEQIYGQIADELGLPEGVLNILVGLADTGAALSNHPGIDKLSFTGSNAVGSQVMRSAAAYCRPVTLELGGKSAILVFEDCDLDKAVEWIIAGICWNAGQMCSATSRLLVHESIADALMLRLKSAFEKLRVGNPLTDEADMGPLTSEAQWIKVNEYFDIAKDEGLHCLTGGASQRFGPGWYVRPTIYIDVPSSSRLWTEEIFGPVLCSQRFATQEQAVAMANDSRFGLVATVISADVERAVRVAEALEVGHVWINSVQVVFAQTSWGGTKGSGIGRELGPWGLSAYQSIKHITQFIG